MTENERELLKEKRQITREQLQEDAENVRKKVNRGRILIDVIKSTGTYKFLVIFIVLFFALAAILWLREPGIETYGDSLWLCFASATTIGFGDVVTTTLIGRICVIILSLYAIVLTAIITSIIVAYHNRILESRLRESLSLLVDKAENLPDLSREELAELSAKIKKYI